MRLVFNILSFWQVGTGEGDMGTFDSRAARDPLGLPLIPGRQVKGLCRQAMHDAEELGIPGIVKGTTRLLFGTRAAAGAPPLDDPTSGLLRFSDARLPEAIRTDLQGNEALIGGLYQTRRSTAMTDKGVARKHSLRFDEVVVPLTLEATVTRNGTDAPADGSPADWEKLVEAILPLISAIGSGRTRGMGRVIVGKGN